MNRAQAWQYAQAQSKVGAKSPRPLDPRTNAMNHHKARLANASVADATKMPSNTNVRPNELSDGNHENNRLKADILPLEANEPLRSVSEPPAPPVAEGQNPSDADGVTALQRKAVLNLVKGTSITDTAQICGVDEWTLRTWLQIPEVDRLYSTARQQNIDSLTATIQAAALKAAATLIRLSESDIPSIQTRAAKALVQLANTTKAAAQKAQVAAEVAKARQEDLTVELGKVKTLLGANAKNWEKIRTSLVHGTFRRPGWLPRESWERIINAKYDVSVAW